MLPRVRPLSAVGHWTRSHPGLAPRTSELVVVEVPAGPLHPCPEVSQRRQGTSLLGAFAVVAELAVIVVTASAAFVALPVLASIGSELRAPVSVPAGSGASAAPPATEVPVLPSPLASSPATPPAEEPAATPRPGRVLLHLAGRGTYRSALFVTDSSWSVAWGHPGTARFSLRIIPAGSSAQVMELASVTGTSEGASVIGQAGGFRIEVRSIDAWTVTVRDLEDVVERRVPAVLEGSGPMTSPLLSSEGPWVLEWETDTTTPVRIELVPGAPGGTGAPRTLVNAGGLTSSCTEVPFSGRFSLRVATTARWVIRLLPLDGEIVCPQSPAT